MPAPLIETSSQYRALCRRIAALETHLRAIDAVSALAREHLRAGCTEPEDSLDLGPLDDARSDIAYTVRGLTQAVGEWEERGLLRRHSN